MALIEYDEVRNVCYYVIFGFLAAFGFLTGVRCLAGLLLRKYSNIDFAVCCCDDPIVVIRLFFRLREAGLAKATITMIDSNLKSEQQLRIQQQYPYIRFCSGKQWLAAQGRERAYCGAGDGNSSRDDCGGSISEL